MSINGKLLICNGNVLVLMLLVIHPSPHKADDGEDEDNVDTNEYTPENNVSPVEIQSSVPVNPWAELSVPAPNTNLRIEPRIVGGRNASIKDHPWQASLQNRGGFHFCGAAIIHPNWAVTAAHCVENRTAGDLQVVAGATDRRDRRIRSDVKRIIIHEEFRSGPGAFPHDIALLELSTDLTAFPEVAAIGISPSFSVDLTHENKRCTITGWGRLSGSGPTSDILQEVDMRAISSDECRRLIGSSFHEPFHFCVLSIGGRSSACRGDSGGPLVCDGVLTGVTSFGREGCLSTFPSVYTRLSTFHSWLTQHTGIDFRQSSVTIS